MTATKTPHERHLEAAAACTSAEEALAAARALLDHERERLAAEEAAEARAETAFDGAALAGLGGPAGGAAVADARDSLEFARMVTRERRVRVGGAEVQLAQWEHALADAQRTEGAARLPVLAVRRHEVAVAVDQLLAALEPLAIELEQLNAAESEACGRAGLRAYPPYLLGAVRAALWSIAPTFAKLGECHQQFANLTPLAHALPMPPEPQ